MAFIYNGSSAPASPTNLPHHVTGQYLAKAHLTRRQRAKIAADLSTGAATVYPLTAKQSAVIARVPVLDVTKVRRNGKPSNGRSNGRETLAEHIARSSPAERAQAGREVGVHVVWDTIINPVIDEERNKTLVAICQAEAEQAAANGNSTV